MFLSELRIFGLIFKKLPPGNLFAGFVHDLFAEVVIMLSFHS